MPVIAAPAKINLYLDILGRRADGYHEILTVFYPLPALADTLEIAEAEPGIRLRCATPGVPEDASNLCCRAAAAFAEAAKIAPRWSLRLEKRIPVAGGCGGGSSDAAATLRLLNQMHGSPLSREVLHGLATRLGADVPFFLQPLPARATGIGEQLVPVPGSLACGLVLANPGFPIPASWAYAHWRDLPKPPATDPQALLAALAAADAPRVAAQAYNVFDAAIGRKFPVLALLLEDLRAAGCWTAHVSGSGPTVFGLCPRDRTAAVAARLREIHGESLWVAGLDLGAAPA